MNKFKVGDKVKVITPPKYAGIIGRICHKDNLTIRLNNIPKIMFLYPEVVSVCKFDKKSVKCQNCKEKLICIANGVS